MDRGRLTRRRKPDPSLAVAYIRVSTSEQEIGPDAQRHAIEQWCERHKIEIVCPPFTDHGVSGGKDFERRPGLVDAYDALKAYNAGILVAHKRDRIARDREVIGNFSLMLRKIGSRICTTDKPPGSGVDIDPMLKAMEGVQDVFAELERSMIRARTKAALDVKRRRGERIGTVPYGYMLAPDGCKLLPEPREQKMVKLVRRLRAGGSSLRSIAAELEDRGFRPRTGKAWHAATIKQIAEYDYPEEPKS